MIQDNVYQVVLEQDTIFIMIKNVLKIIIMKEIRFLPMGILLLKNMQNTIVNVMTYGIMMKSLRKKNVLMLMMKMIVILLVIPNIDIKLSQQNNAFLIVMEIFHMNLIIYVLKNVKIILKKI